MKLLLVSHGNFASGLLESFEMIAGSNKNIETISLKNEGTEAFREELNTYLLNYSDEQILVFCDLKGGTPFNEVYRIFLEMPDRIRVVSGMNLPMLIEIGTMMNSLNDLDILKNTSVTIGQDSIQTITDEEDIENELEF